MSWNVPLELTSEERHRFFLFEAYKAGYALSDDLQTKVGAVLVKQELDTYRMVARGANHLNNFVDRHLSYEDLTANLFDKAWKYQHMIHGEHAVIETALQNEVFSDGLIMYMPWVPCDDCAKRIHLAKISMLVTHKELVERTPERWRESTNKAIDYLLKKNITCLMYTGTIGNTVSVFGGQVILV